MELYQLTYFERIARCESVSRAAEELHISQSALSKAVAKLEAELGVELFDRVGKRLVLNDRGAFYLQNVTKLLEDANESANALRRFDEVGDESVKISVCGPQKEALNCTTEFMYTEPNVRITFDVRHTLDKRYSLWSSDVVFYPMGNPFDISVGIPYSVRRLNMAVSQSHPLAGTDKASISQFKDDQFILLNEPHEIYETSYRLCLDNGFPPIVRAITSNKAALLEFVRKGFGVGLLDQNSSGQNMSGTRFVKLTNDTTIQTLCFAHRRPDRMSPAARRYVDFVCEHFKVPESQRQSAVFDN